MTGEIDDVNQELYYQTSDCTDTAYIIANYTYHIIKNGAKFYIADNNATIQNFGSGVVKSYRASSDGICHSPYDPGGGFYISHMIEVTLPFTLPIRVPVRLEMQ